MGVNNPATAIQPGNIDFFAASSAPAGWLKANGAAVSRTTYALLFAAIGTIYGAGDGSTTFNVPDLRGEFPRGFDDGRGVDVGRAIGTAQAQDMQTHAHTLGATETAGGASAVLYSPSGDGSVAKNFTTSSAGTTETRPRNIAFLGCIKY